MKEMESLQRANQQHRLEKENDLDLYRYLLASEHVSGLSRTDGAWSKSFLPVNASQKCKISKP